MAGYNTNFLSLFILISINGTFSNSAFLGIRSVLLFLQLTIIAYPKFLRSYSVIYIKASGQLGDG